jgi:hypothetical protein
MTNLVRQIDDVTGLPGWCSYTGSIIRLMEHCAGAMRRHGRAAVAFKEAALVRAQ